MTLRVRRRYCRRCSHCECQRVHSRDHWSRKRAMWIALGTLALLLCCGFGCNWSTLIH